MGKDTRLKKGAWDHLFIDETHLLMRGPHTLKMITITDLARITVGPGKAPRFLGLLGRVGLGRAGFGRGGGGQRWAHALFSPPLLILH